MHAKSMKPKNASDEVDRQLLPFAGEDAPVRLETDREGPVSDDSLLNRNRIIVEFCLLWLSMYGVTLTLFWLETGHLWRGAALGLLAASTKAVLARGIHLICDWWFRATT